MALERISQWKRRKFAIGSVPRNDVVIQWIKDGLYYGEQIGRRGDWYIDEARDPAEAPHYEERHEPVLHHDDAGLRPETIEILRGLVRP